MLAERLKTLCQSIFTEFSFSENNIHIIGNISYHSYSQNDQEELIALKRITISSLMGWISKILFKDVYALRYLNLEEYVTPIQGTSKKIFSISFVANPLPKYSQYSYVDKFIQVNATKIMNCDNIQIDIEFLSPLE